MSVTPGGTTRLVPRLALRLAARLALRAITAPRVNREGRVPAMIRTSKASLTLKIALFVACLACLSLVPATVAAGAEGTVTYHKESLSEYQKQLAGGHIKSVTINKKLRSVRVTLKDGRFVLAKYARHEEPKVVAALNAKHVPVIILKPTEAAKEAKTKKPAHKLRYLVGGILVVVVIVVGAVLLIDRRRKRANE